MNVISVTVADCAIAAHGAGWFDFFIIVGPFVLLKYGELEDIVPQDP